MAGLTAEQLDKYWPHIRQRLVGQENVSAEITIRGGRLNVRASLDEVFIHNGKVLGDCANSEIRPTTAVPGGQAPR